MNIFVVASDPGSANALMPVIAACCRNGHEVYGVVSGSAATMFGKQWHEIKETDDAVSKEKISNIWKDNKPHIVLAGAGAYNLLEHTVRRAAAEVNIPCIAVLDYWANYNERFRRLESKKWSYSLPDRICVLDEIVRKEMLAEGFAPEKIVVTGQPYFECIANWSNTHSLKDVELYRNRFVKDERSILIGFYSEPIAEDLKVMHQDDIGYTQYDTIPKVVSILGRLANSSDRPVHLVVRPHPREDEKKLKEILVQIQTSSMFTWEISRTGTSLEFVVSCDLLVGMTSMALIEACIMSRPVLSIQLNLKKTDTFFGTTRGFCASLYSDKELNYWLERWFTNAKTRPRTIIQYTCNAMPFSNGAIERIMAVMKELAEICKPKQSTHGG